LKKFCKLAWPIPWYYKLPSPYLSLDEISENEDVVRNRQDGLNQLREIPLFNKRDTPTRSLYRMYEDLGAALFPKLGLEAEYFYFHPEPRWELSQIPDPKDESPVRYAILASLVEALADSSNWRLSLGLLRDGTKVPKMEERIPFIPLQIPEWTQGVPAVEKTVFLLERGTSVNPLTRYSEPFQKRNITTTMGYLYTF
jgi:hypothetical protein